MPDYVRSMGYHGSYSCRFRRKYKSNRKDISCRSIIDALELEDFFRQQGSCCLGLAVDHPFFFFLPNACFSQRSGQIRGAGQASDGCLHTGPATSADAFLL